MATVFLDESGSFVRCKNQDYFVVASFTVGNPRRTAKQFRAWQRTKFPKRKQLQSENKFSDQGISDSLRLKTIQFIASLDVRIRFGFFRCDNIPQEYIAKDKVSEGHLYAQIVGEILESYYPNSDAEFRVFCDQRHLKSMRRGALNDLLVARLLPVAPKGTRIVVKQVDSVTDVNIQIADWIVGALAAALNAKHLGTEYQEILRSNIIGEPIELFKRRGNR